ncbi:MAG: CHASE2 domain-containing protein [Syntrophaceae bacterium]|nr:CHASE2 domain-containing protein [Syntrophaceae bacterium]
MSPIRRINEPRRITLFVGLLLTLVLVGIYLLNPSFIRFFKHKTTDDILAGADFQERSGSVVVVDIDEKSLKKFGQWPWPRYRMAELLEKISALGAISIGLNMVFAEADRASPRIWQDTISDPSGYQIEIKGVPEGLLDHDAVLKETLTGGPFVLGYEFLFKNGFGKSQIDMLHPLMIVWMQKQEQGKNPNQFFEAKGVICNLKQFSESVRFSGFLNATPDSDGMLRRVPMIIKYGTHYFPSITLATLMQALKTDQVLFRKERNGQNYLFLNGRAIPLDSYGNMRVNFSPERIAAGRVSAGDVLSGTVSPHDLKDKIVFVAPSASGLERSYQTPRCPIFPDTEVHAQVAEAILSERYIVRNRDFLLWEVAAGACLAAVYCLCLVSFGAITNSIIGVFFIFGTWQAAMSLFKTHGLLLSPLLPSLIVAVLFIVLTIFIYWNKHSSARKEMENALVLAKTNQNRLNSIIGTIPDIVYRLDHLGRITFISQAVLAYHQSPEVLLGREILDLVPVEERGLAKFRINERRTGKRATKGMELRLMLGPTPIDATQNVRHFSISAQGIYRSEKPNKDSFLGTQGIARDITEKKQLENQLVQAKKMEVVATLAGGVAHDLNNILTSIVSYPDILLMELPEDSSHRRIVEAIKESGEKAAEIVQDLLTLARRGVVTQEIINLNSIVQDYLKSPQYDTVCRNYPRAVIRAELATEPVTVQGSPVHLFKVIMNLVNNAAEAMPVGGEIVLRTETCLLDRPLKGYVTVPVGEYARLSIIDNGVGISKDDINEIFEPFFTKKRMKKSGSGLGMTVVWATVQDHGGYVDIDSREGEGTRFDFYFPAAREVIASTQHRMTLDDYTGHERILVVDDNQEQCEIAAKMLGKLGYSVASVLSGEKAVEYLKKNTAELIMLDMVMEPGIDGLETYRRVIARHPRQKAIIASGFMETERVRELQELGVVTSVRKPFTLEKIGMAVRKELDRQ